MKKPFAESSRKQRCKKYITIKNLITKEQRTKGRNFYSHHLINEKDITDEDIDLINEINRPHHWLDLYFMSKKSRTFYNVALITKNMAAMDDLDEKLSYNENPPEHSYDTVKCDNGMVEMKFTDEYEDYFKRSEHNKEHQLIDYFNSGVETVVKTEIRFDHTYVSGIGLYATIDADSLTEEVVMAWINEFLSSGENETTGNDVVVPNESIKKMYHYKFEV